MESGPSRSYQMRKRAENVAETRQRIIDATVRLHTSVGPARTTIAGIAGEAGVTRATVYSHFADDDALFTACTNQWVSEHPPPDWSGWGDVPDLTERAQRALDELYRWYAETAAHLRLLARDVDSVPEFITQTWAAFESATAQALLAGTASEARSLDALAAHLVAFATWDSLSTRGGLDHTELVDLAVGLLQCATALSGCSED